MRKSDFLFNVARRRVAMRETHSEQMLDKTLADTFPANDPLSTLPNPSFDSFDSPAQVTQNPKTSRGDQIE
jgi:hypothetical protein